MLSGKHPRAFVNRIVPREQEQEELYISELLKLAIDEITEIKLFDDSNKNSISLRVQHAEQVMCEGNLLIRSLKQQF